MGTTRFKGETASERLNFESISDSDMIQVRHLPGTLNDTDKGISKAQLMSCPFGVCDTAANTALKTVSLADSNPDFVLVSGREVVIYFANANTETSPVINFEGSGSYPLFFDNGSPVGTWAAGTWMHLKFFSVEINDTLIQRWILLSPLPVNAVTANNMQSVTSNAVYAALPMEVHHITEKAQSAPAIVDTVDIWWTKSGKIVTITGFVHFTGAGGGKVVTGFPNILTGHIAPLSSINTTAGGLLDAEIEDNGLFINNTVSGGGYCRVSGSYICS